jgi:hypothetical protein
MKINLSIIDETEYGIVKIALGNYMYGFQNTLDNNCGVPLTETQRSFNKNRVAEIGMLRERLVSEWERSNPQKEKGNPILDRIISFIESLK